MNNAQSSIQATLKETIAQHGFKRILLAVSGGLDSICLAHFFIVHKQELGIEWLGIAHVHHGLREVTADRDAEFVRDFASKNNCPFFLERLDGTALKEAGGSLEEKARDARYEALRAIAMENRARAIVTAHHAGDQAETIYLRLHRGVSLAGLRGIQTIRKFNEYSCNEGISIISLFRPFLNMTREDLRSYAQEFNLSWCEDESNEDVKFARNKIRHERLPQLEKLYPGASRQLCRVAGLAARAYDKVLMKAESLFEPAVIPREQWPFDARYARYGKVAALEIDVLDHILDATPSFVELFRLWLTEKGFRLPLRENGTSIPFPFQQRLQCKTVVIEKCRHILWIYDVSSEAPSKSEHDNLYFDTDKFSGLDGQWRYRTKGDTLWPADEKIKARKLEQWLREQGIPQWMHDSLPLFAQGSRVFFVEGVRRAKSRRFKE